MRKAACWAHLRRDFHDFWTSTKSEIAREALDLIGKLYDIKRDREPMRAIGSSTMARGQPADVRHATRQKHSLPKVMAFFT
ncbi:MAG: transposase [Dinoroseobacter sp.]